MLAVNRKPIDMEITHDGHRTLNVGDNPRCHTFKAMTTLISGGRKFANISQTRTTHTPPRKPCRRCFRDLQLNNCKMFTKVRLTNQQTLTWETSGMSDKLINAGAVLKNSFVNLPHSTVSQAFHQPKTWNVSPTSRLASVRQPCAS